MGNYSLKPPQKILTCKKKPFRQILGWVVATQGTFSLFNFSQLSSHLVYVPEVATSVERCYHSRCWCSAVWCLFNKLKVLVSGSYHKTTGMTTQDLSVDSDTVKCKKKKKKKTWYLPVHSDTVNANDGLRIPGTGQHAAYNDTQSDACNCTIVSALWVYALGSFLLSTRHFKTRCHELPVE